MYIVTDVCSYKINFPTISKYTYTCLPANPNEAMMFQKTSFSAMTNYSWEEKIHVGTPALMFG